ncbi:hypothetical protein [Mesorhizobium sp. A556]
MIIARECAVLRPPREAAQIPTSIIGHYLEVAQNLDLNFGRQPSTISVHPFCSAAGDYHPSDFAQQSIGILGS